MSKEAVESTDTPTLPSRDPLTGQFQAHNFAALMHALRTNRLPPEFECLVTEVEEYASASILDDGGRDNITLRRQTLHEYRARLHRRVVQLDSAIELKGVCDKHGKLRVAWLNQLQGLMKTALAIDRRLGLERRQKAVPTPAEYWRERQKDGSDAS